MKECSCIARRDYSHVSEFVRLGEQRCGYLAQGIETHDDGIEHDHQVLPTVETLDVTFTPIGAAHAHNFTFVEKTCHLT